MIDISTMPSARRAPSGAILLAEAGRIFGAANVLTLVDMGDASPGALATLPNRKGAALTPKSTARATAASTLGRMAAVFSANAAGMGYIARTGVKTQIAVARWDGALPFPNYNGLLTSNEYPGLIGYLGTSNLFPHGTIYKDAAVSDVVDNAAHYWASTNAVASTGEVLVGNAINTPALNWVGPIWHICQLPIVATAAQLVAYSTALKSEYPFLP